MDTKGPGGRATGALWPLLPPSLFLQSYLQSYFFSLILQSYPAGPHGTRSGTRLASLPHPRGDLRPDKGNPRPIISFIWGGRLAAFCLITMGGPKQGQGNTQHYVGDVGRVW